MIVPAGIFRQWEIDGKGNCSQYDKSELYIGGIFPNYCDGIVKRRWATCKITSITPNNYGGSDYIFDVYGCQFGELYEPAEPNPWYWNWFGIF